MTLDDRRCWTDAREFEQQCARLEQREQRRKTPLWPSACEDAITLYHGPFLPAQGEKAWVTPTRERLREMFVRVVARRSDHYRREGRIEQAIAWLDKGLRLHPQTEPLYLSLIALLLAGGRQTEARAVYHQCVRVYVHELGQRLPTAVVQLYKKELQ